MSKTKNKNEVSTTQDVNKKIIYKNITKHLTISKTQETTNNSKYQKHKMPKTQDIKKRKMTTTKMKNSRYHKTQDTNKKNKL